MQFKAATVNKITHLFGLEEANQILHFARKSQIIENKWKDKTNKLFKSYASEIAEMILNENVNLDKIDFEAFYMQHWFDVSKHAIQSTQRLAPIPNKSELARMPRSLNDLMEIWDAWRKKKIIPRHQAAIAKRVKRAYINRIQKTVSKFQDRIRSGEVIQKYEIQKTITDWTSANRARANTIVETETTRYYNTTRKQIYDRSHQVTHYLFLAIRDSATTKWCKTRTGLVYAKGDPLLRREQPPCHWNCRSEILPLTPANARHLKLIQDPTLLRRNHKCEPLPPGWNSYAA